MSEIVLDKISENLFEMQKLLDNELNSDEKDRVEELNQETKKLFDELEYLEELFYDKMLDPSGISDYKKCKKLKHEFEDLQSNYDFEEEESDEDIKEGSLDMMFPNRHDDDFDEDSMSGDQVFRDE